MDTNALTGGHRRGYGVSAGKKVDAPRKQQRGIVGDQVLEGRQLQLQGLQRGGDLGVDSARVAGKVFWGKELGRERRVAGGSHKSQVHLGGTASKARGCHERRAGVVKSFVRKRAVIEKAGRGDPWRSWKSLDRAQEAGELVEKPAPAVSFIHDPPLQHRSCGFFPVCGSHPDFTEEGSNSLEMSDFGQETNDLGVGILSRLKAPEELQDHLMAVRDRGVGLLRRAYSRGQRHGYLGFGEMLGGTRFKQAVLRRGNAGEGRFARLKMLGACDTCACV